VVSIDALKRRVQIGPKESLYSQRAVVTDVRWLGDEPSSLLRCGVQIRYRRVPQPATVRRIDERSVSVQFDDPELAVTPGQAAVFYDGDEVLGGGFIADSSTTLATTWAAEAAPAP